MKSLNYKIRACRFRMFTLLALFCCTTVFCYGQDKPKKSDLFYSKIVTLKPGLTKEEVKKTMGEPYKISVRRRLAALSSAKSPDFVVLKARLLPCISRMEYGKQELSF